MTPHDFTLFMYNMALIPVIFFSVLFFIISVINIFLNRSKKITYKKMEKLPFISIQIPTYNDPIAERCLKHCVKLDYPKDMYEIIIADDSTNVKTQKLLKKYSIKYPNFVNYIHRNNRENFKAGALANAMRLTKGEFIVIFDSDWMPGKDFLKNIIQPFSDPKVAIVQSAQGIYNKDSNLVTRFAAYLLMIYHSMVMPINNKLNCVFFCGTAGAIRKSAFLDVGGWNLNSITEDADLSVNLVLRGYKSVYLDFETPSEVPSTFEGFIKQQMRWCYGNVRVFFDNAFKILFSQKISFGMRMMIMYVTLGNVIAPVVLIMTLFGFAGWFLGEFELINVNEVVTLISRFIYTSGFIFMGAFALYKKKQLKEFPYLFLSALTMGLVLCIANSIAFFRAVSNKKLAWFCTPKAANNDFEDGHS